VATSCIAVLLGAVACPTYSSEPPAKDIVFRLVPLEHWSRAEEYPARALPEGVIRLYRNGSHQPELIADANHSVRVPEGRWTWIAEAPGYVSVASGLISVGDDCRPTGQAHTLYWWVVPACQLSFEETSAWTRVQRLDIASLSYSSVHPLDPSSTHRAQIPAGSYIPYSVSGNRLFSIGAPGVCGREEEQVLSFPEPPASDRQALVVHLSLPEGSAPSQDGTRYQEDLILYLEPAGRPPAMPVPPTAVVWSENRGSFFFQDFSAEVSWRLTGEHPRLQSIRLPIEKLGGDARELTAGELLPRHDLVFDIDYRPKRPHESAKVVPHYCGPDRENGKDCMPLEDKAAPLIEGLMEYRFENLDWGQYLFTAEIDDFAIEGLGRPLGSYFRPYLYQGENHQVPRERFNLWEYHVYGNVLLDEEPVEGFARLDHPAQRRPTQRAATDSELLYHLYYFAEEPSVYALSHDERRAGRNPSELPPGLPAGYKLSACDLEGFCRYFNAHTEIRGEGRLDLELGSSTTLTVEVVDADSSQPIEGARVLVPSQEKALIFERGEVRWSKPLGDEGDLVLTTSEGLARFRNVAVGRLPLTVLHEGFETEQTAAWILPFKRSTEIVVELVKDGDRPGDVLVRFADGAPAGNAFFLPINEDGSRDLGCYAVANAEGRVRFRPGCLQSRKYLVIHRDAVIAAIDGSQIRSAPTIMLDRQPPVPLRIRVTDVTGQPMAGIPVELRYPDFYLRANDLLAAARSGGLLFYLTDERGELALRGVDPDAPLVPSLLVGTETFSLVGYESGDTIPIFLESD
jgi:hypothetical protein